MRVPIFMTVTLLLASVSVLGSAAAEGKGSKFKEVGDLALWRQSVLDGAFNELRCWGYSASEAERICTQRFARRDQDGKGAMQLRYGPLPLEDIILIGKKCPAYRGAIRAHEDRLRELEKRLGL